MKNKFETVLIGATFFSVGYASHAEDCLIIDRSDIVGSDFCAAMNASSCKGTYSLGALGLYRDALRRGLTDNDGRITIVPTAALLAKYISDKIPNILLGCEITDVSEKRLTAFGSRGFFGIEANRIIDTRPVLSPRITRTAAAMLTDGTPPRELCGNDWFIQKGLYENEYILHAVLEENDDCVTAQKKLTALASGADKVTGTLKIAAFATEFAYFCDNIGKVATKENGITRIPSAAFKNPFEAFYGGEKYALYNTL